MNKAIAVNRKYFSVFSPGEARADSYKEEALAFSGTCDLLKRTHPTKPELSFEAQSCPEGTLKHRNPFLFLLINWRRQRMEQTHYALPPTDKDF